jgi:hypothetical protein
MSNQASERRLQDAAVTQTVALPTGAATANTNSVDLGQATPFPITEAFHVKLSTTVATGANNKNITVRVQDSADGTTFANIAAIGALTVADANGAGFPAGSLTVSLPPDTRRYVRGQATSEANGGDSTDGSLTVAFLF